MTFCMQTDTLEKKKLTRNILERYRHSISDIPKDGQNSEFALRLSNGFSDIKAWMKHWGIYNKLAEF